MKQITEEPDMPEFVTAIVKETEGMINVVELVKEELITTFGNDRDYSIAIEAAEEMRGELIRGTYSRVLSALMQPPREKPPGEEAAEVAASTLADRLGEQEQEQQPTRAGRGVR